MSSAPSKKKPVCLLDIDGTLAITDCLYVLAFKDLMAGEGVTDTVDDAWFAKHVARRAVAGAFTSVRSVERARS